MKLTVVECPCGNPKPHRKFQDDARRKTDGFFSLAQGRSILTKLKNRGDVTEAEAAEADAELVATGLPEYAVRSEQELENIALTIMATTPPGRCDGVVAQNVEAGAFSPADADSIRSMIQKFEENPLLALEKAVAGLNQALATA